MAKRKGTNDIAASVRGAFLRAAKMSEEDGRPLSMILLEMLTNDPKSCLDTVSKFIPKEMLVEATVTQQLDELSDEALDREISRLARETSAVALTASEAGATEH